jgi:hypothetical protein
MWLVTQGKAVSGHSAGKIQVLRTGYRRWKIGIDGRGYTAARLAVLYMTGRWPPYTVDHLDGNPLNNAWRNLRLATHKQNCQSMRKHQDNGTGFKGIIFHRGGKKKRTRRYQARIRAFGKDISLGYFLTPEEAHLAYHRADRRLRGPWGSGLSLEKYLATLDTAKPHV